MSGFAQSNPAKLTAFWNFDDASSLTTLDAKHGIVGVLTDGAAYTDAGGGRSGTGADRAVDFGSDAQREKVRVRNVAWLNQIARNDTITISFWQKLRSTGNSYAFWAVTPTRERAVSAHAPWGDGTVYWDTGGAGAGTRISIASSTFGAEFAWTSWNHIVFIKNGTTKQIWVNGVVRRDLADSTVPLVQDISDFAIGMHPYAAPNATTGAIKGWIDEFAVFGGALDEAQITALAGGASPLSLDGDGDSDGMPDWWEDQYALNKASNADAALDGDGDGATNLQEFQRLTDPTITDTDGDGLADGAETGTGVWVSAANTGTDPIRKDTDEDGLADSVETNTGTFVSAENAGSNPLAADTDADGYNDYAEAVLGGNPVSAAVGALRDNQANLLAWWDFNNADVAEYSLDRVHSFKGDLMNGALFTEDALGRTGAANDRALDLGPGAGELMNVQQPQWLNALAKNNAVTISFWQKWHVATPVANNAFYADDLRVYNVPILNGHVPWTDRVVYWDTTSSAAPGGRISRVLPTGFDITGWHHYAFVKNGDAKQIYIDGALHHSGANTGVLPAEVHRLMVGGHTGTPTPKNSMNGLIDDFAIFGKALSATEVGVLAAGSSPGDLAQDADGDGMPDLWEIANDFNKDNAADAAQDADSDGLTNLQEYRLSTLPRDEDSDDDGLRDGVETRTGTWVSATDTGTNPLIADTDSDGVRDGAETNTGTFVSASDTGTSPLLSDSDNDSYSDGMEVTLGSNPVLAASGPIAANGPNLLAYWDFNTATAPAQTVDLIHGIVGNLDGGVIYSEDGEGRSAQGGDLSVVLPGGAGNVVRVADARFVGASATQNQITFSFWQRQMLTTPGASASFWVDAANPALTRWAAAHVPWSDNTIYFDAGGGATAGTHRINRSMTAADPAFDWTVWHHIALVRNGAVAQIWIDGVLFHEGAVTAPLQRDSTQMGIGGQPTGGNAFFGNIDDFAIFASALQEEHIAALARGAAPQSIVFAPGDFRITATSVAGGAFSVTWESQAGQTFRVLRSVNLADWPAVATDVPASATGATTTFTDNNPPAGAAAVFYQIQRQ